MWVTSVSKTNRHKNLRLSKPFNGTFAEIQETQSGLRKTFWHGLCLRTAKINKSNTLDNFSTLQIISLAGSQKDLRPVLAEKHPATFKRLRSPENSTLSSEDKRTISDRQTVAYRRARLSWPPCRHGHPNNVISLSVKMSTSQAFMKPLNLFTTLSCYEFSHEYLLVHRQKYTLNSEQKKYSGLTL